MRVYICGVAYINCHIFSGMSSVLKKEEEVRLLIFKTHVDVIS